MTWKKLQKSTKRIISFLPAIVVGTIVSIIILNTIMPDIPNWMTMTVELGVGFFIAALIFILQEKTSDSLKAYNEEQKRLLRSVKSASLERIEGYLSMAYDVIAFDKDKITSMDETQQLNVVENLLSRHDNEESYQALRNGFPSLETECFMSKPIKIDDLIRRINRTLS